jgi:pyruvate dehydrogenase E2 component (dihydrolipoamide acetyltransferase)
VEVFLLPDVGEGLIEAEIVAWKVAVGDQVTLNQPLVDVETAKAVVELPSPFAGVVATLHAAVGETVEVNAPLVSFDVDAETPPHANEKQVVHDVPDEQRREPVLIGYGVAHEESVAPRRRRRGASAPTPAAASPAAAPLARTTPPVRLLAKHLGVELTTVRGTGRDGIITREDVERAGGSGLASSRTPAPMAARSRFVGREIASWSEGAREERLAVKGVLKSMAEAMLESTTRQPQASVWTRVDATKTVELLRGLKGHPRFSEVRLSALTVVALAVCDAARHFPGINSSFDESRNEVVVRRYVNLGIAADTPRGLVVPNVKDADRLDLAGMARELTTLVEKARDATTTPAEMAGTTITITNVGPFGVDGAMAILPPGTGAIVCVGQVARAPWVQDDAVVVRDVVEISMTFDHRQIDGALASRVLAHIGAFLEDPATALLTR